MEATGLIEKSNTQISSAEWGTFQYLSNEDEEVFYETMKGFIGIAYTPVACATKEEQGISYRFFLQCQG